MTTRDTERTQVYAAEDLSAENTLLAAPRPLGELQSVVSDLLKRRWWRSNCEVPSAAIEVVVNRSMQRSLWLPTRRRISLSPAAMDLTTLCHELAHAAETDFSPRVKDAPVHGRRFRSLHVGVRYAVLGRRCGDDLAEVYGQFGLGMPAPNGAFWGSWAETVLPSALYEAEFIVDPGRPSSFRPAEKSRGPIAL